MFPRGGGSTQETKLHNLACIVKQSCPEQSPDGAKLGSWMVVTEEGIRRFRFYRFENEETAWRYFNDAWHCCVILNDKGEEQAATCEREFLLVRLPNNT